MPHATPDQTTHLTSRRSTATFVPLIVIALLVLLAGCDATSTAGGTPPTDTPRISDSTVTATAQPTAKPTATPLACVSAAGTNVKVSNFSFSPSSLTLKVGTTVTWTNSTSTTDHTVTSDTGAFDCALGAGAKVSIKFSQAGVFPYHCSIHPSMTGMITVTAS